MARVKFFNPKTGKWEYADKVFSDPKPCVTSVNGVSPDKNGNVEVSAMPDDVEQVFMLIEADMLPAVHYNGAIITDEKGNIIFRY